MQPTIEQPNIKVLVFDFFGVICPDLVDIWIEQNGLLKQGESIRTQFVALADVGLLDFDQECAGLGRVVGRSASDVHSELMKIAVLNFDVISLMKKLSNSYKVAILSNAPKGLVEEILRHFAVELPLGALVVSGDVGTAKPLALPYQRVMEPFQEDAKSFVMIDDRIKNVDGAIAIGMRGIHFSSIGMLMSDLEALGVDT